MKLAHNWATNFTHLKVYISSCIKQSTGYAEYDALSLVIERLSQSQPTYFIHDTHFILLVAPKCIFKKTASRTQTDISTQSEVYSSCSEQSYLTAFLSHYTGFILHFITVTQLGNYSIWFRTKMQNWFEFKFNLDRTFFVRYSNLK